MADDCLFCDPVEQAGAVAANLTMFARFDKYPATPGHVLIIPFDHVGSFFSLSPLQRADAWDLLQRMRGRIAVDYHPDGFNIGINDGEAAGRTVHHLHIHLIPRYAGDQDDPRGGIRRGLPNGDPDAWAAALPRKDCGQ